MPLFDSYLMVDWSAASRPRTGKDSIWWALRTADGCEHVGNPATRAKAREEIRKIFFDAIERPGKLLAGFDFPFGYPRGTAAAIAGTPNWRSFWQSLGRDIQDGTDNSNNRFMIAAKYNQHFQNEGPFWGHPHQHVGRYPGLSRYAPIDQRLLPPLRRHVEERARTSKTDWQLWGNGCVGSQALLGIACLNELLCHGDIRPHVAVWPFEVALTFKSDRRIVLAEIYPSILAIERAPGVPFDRIQVETMARYFQEWDSRGDFAAAFELPEVENETERADIEREEGCILGVGCELPALRSAVPR